jgi:hypothetical protein
MRVVLCVVVSLVAVACDEPPYIPPKVEIDTTVDPDTDTINETVNPNCGIQPTLSDINDKYFSKACTFGGCHDSSSAEGGLDLEVASLHSVLVNVAAADPKAGPRNKLRVVPGDPDNSFLVQKLEGTMERDEGNIMPDGADEPIDPECRIAMVRKWITDGALDN